MLVEELVGIHFHFNPVSPQHYLNLSEKSPEEKEISFGFNISLFHSPQLGESVAVASYALSSL